ncbi:MAG: hypothetical protein R2867_05605 [Caldilineaceae bacterium]
MTATTINLQRFVSTSHEFYELCQENPSLEMERTANGEVIIMFPLPGVKQVGGILISTVSYGYGIGKLSLAIHLTLQPALTCSMVQIAHQTRLG